MIRQKKALSLADLRQFETCQKCKQTRPVTEFSKCRSRMNGLQKWCKACANPGYVRKGPAPVRRGPRGPNKWTRALEDRATKQFLSELSTHGLVLLFKRGYGHGTDPAGVMHTLYVGTYTACIDPVIFRLKWDCSSFEHYGREYAPQGRRAELSFLPNELPAVARFVAREIQAGRELPSYDWTPRAWKMNRHGLTVAQRINPRPTDIDTVAQLPDPGEPVPGPHD
jgi:hypothetical protein